MIIFMFKVLGNKDVYYVKNTNLKEKFSKISIYIVIKTPVM